MTDHPVLQDILVPRNPGSLNIARVQNESCCAIKYDRVLRVPVLVMKGGLSNARVQVPREDRPLSSVHPPHSLIVLQAYLGSFDSFAVEATMSINTLLRVKLTIGTQFNKAFVEDPCDGVIVSGMPLIIPRNRWVQVVFHVLGIVTHLLDLPPIKSIDSIALSGTCRVSRLMTSNDEGEAINNTPADMALFAVPAYAPPIWQTAAALVSPIVANGSKAPAGNSVTTESPGTRLPVVGDLSTERRRMPALVRQDEPPKPQAPPPRLERPSPRIDFAQSSQSSFSCDGSQENQTLATLRSPVDTQQQQRQTQQQQQQQQKQQQQAQPVSENGSAAYIRLVSQTNVAPNRNNTVAMRMRSNNFVAKENANNSGAPPSVPAAASSEVGAPGVADTWCGITGWEETIDPVGAISVASPNAAECAGKVQSAARLGSVGERAAAAAAVGTNKSNNVTEPLSPKSQRLKKLVELRKRPALLPNRQRRTGRLEGQTATDGDNGVGAANGPKKKCFTVKYRRLRTRIKLLKEAQVSARRMQEMKKLPASELPIDPQEEALMMVGDESVDVMLEPRCGYGFGYLGVLREGGGFETDEGADTKLKGALTLELSEEDDEEEDDDCKEEEDADENE